MIKHFVSLSNLSTSDLLGLIDRANYFSSISQQPDQFKSLLKNKIIANLFYEPSTRTRCSFEIAIKKLGAQVINLDPEKSSSKKGETILDTIKTLESLQVDAITIRHADDHIFDHLVTKVQVPLINAGSGKLEHPTQTLLDLLTLKQEFNDLVGLKIAICGDIKHSRVASSFMMVAEKLGISITICGPEVLLPKVTQKIVRSSLIDDVITDVDAIIMLRVQLERHQELEIDEKNYLKDYGLNMERINKMKKHSIVMHPGPFNRGIEIADEAIDHEKSRIFKQMTNGVFARMAILEWIFKK
jgi:aspartate carbamoyltransferase catalytic subunit